MIRVLRQVAGGRLEVSDSGREVDVLVADGDDCAVTLLTPAEARLFATHLLEMADFAEKTPLDEEVP